MFAHPSLAHTLLDPLRSGAVRARRPGDCVWPQLRRASGHQSSVPYGGVRVGPSTRSAAVRCPRGLERCPAAAAAVQPEATRQPRVWATLSRNSVAKPPRSYPCSVLLWHRSDNLSFCLVLGDPVRERTPQWQCSAAHRRHPPCGEAHSTSPRPCTVTAYTAPLHYVPTPLPSPPQTEVVEGTPVECKIKGVLQVRMP
jgi:hypothetical protein